MHPKIKVQLRTFESLKPHFVRRLKDRYTCCCIYHVQMGFLKDSVNLLRHHSASLTNTVCTCGCPICRSSPQEECKSSEQVITSMSYLLDSILCPRETDAIFHSHKCVMGLCQDCGPSRFRWCPNELSSEILISVKLFESVNTNFEGKVCKRKDLVRKMLKPRDLVSLFVVSLGKFIKHNFIYSWQAHQFKNCISDFPNDVVVSVVDFAENYTFKQQNEIQSMHWCSVQVTIFVHITYFRVSGDIKKVIHFFISDDKKHDTLFVQHCFKLHWQWLLAQRLEVTQHWVWSDGAASQFKARRPFYFVGRYPAITGLEMRWNFFGSGHGKGEHDGAGAVIKRALTHEQLKTDGVQMNCASDVVEFLRTNMSTGATGVYSSQVRDIKREFWEVKIDEVNREKTWECGGIPELRSLHAVRGYSRLDGHCIAVRELTCFCFHCVQGNWRHCLNKAYIQNWEYHTLIDKEAVDGETGQNADFTYEGLGDTLSDVLNVGDNFAVNAEEDNSEGADFYILKCTVSKQCARQNMVDAWGNFVSAGTFYIEGIFYAKLDDYEYVYRLLEDKPAAYMLSHLVRCINVPMSEYNSCSGLYTVGGNVYECIYNSMPWNL